MPEARPFMILASVSIMFLVMLPAFAVAPSSTVLRSAARAISINPSAIKKPITYVGVGPQPTSVSYDPGSATVYVMNHGSSYVSVLDKSGTLVKNLLSGGSPSGAAYDPTNGKMYVTNQDDSTITVFDAQRNVQTGTMDSGVQNPVAIAYDPANGKLFVASTSANDVAVIDPAAGGVSHFSMTSPVAFVYDSVDTWMYVVGGTQAPPPTVGGPPAGGSSGDTVTALGPGDGVIDKTFTVGHGARGATVDPEGNVYVANQNDDTISVINHQGVTNFPGGPQPWGVIYDSKTRHLFVSSPVAGVSAVDTGGNSVLLINATVLLPGGKGGGSLGEFGSSSAFLPLPNSNNVAFFPVPNKNLIALVLIAALTPYFTSGPGNYFPGYNYLNHQMLISDNFGVFRQIVAWTSVTHKLVKTISLSGNDRPGAIAYSPVTGHMYVLDPTLGGKDTGYIQVIDTKDNLINTINVGDFLAPVAIAYNADDGNMYVTVTAITGFHNKGYVDVIDSSDTIAKVIPVGANVGGITYDSQDQQMYVANGGDGTVSEINDGCLCVTYTFSAFSSKTLYTIYMAYDPVSNTVYASDWQDSYVVSIYSSAVSSYISVPSPTGIAINGADGYLWVISGSHIVLIDTGSDTVKATLKNYPIDFGGTPADSCYGFQVAYNPWEKTSWLTNRGVSDGSSPKCDNFVIFTS